jgi:hypothetical protein
MKSKIFIGLTNIASAISDFKIAFAKLGYETITAIYKNHSIITSSDVDYDFYKMETQSPNWYDHVRPYKLRFILQRTFKSSAINPKDYIYKKAIKECDIFIFIWQTFHVDNDDIAYLKSIGKKVVCIHVGDDVRWQPAMRQEFGLYGYEPIRYEENYFERITKQQKLIWLRNSEKYADLIYSRADQNQLALRPHYKWRMMVIPSNFTPNFYQNESNPLVIHSPSNRLSKGTEYLIEAVRQVKNEGIKFDFQLIENMPHNEALRTYQKADIVIDQLLCPGAGKFATECLAMGKVVMAKMGYGVYPDYIPEVESNPIIDVCPQTIYQKLKDIILDYDLRQKKSQQAPEYVNKHLNFDLFCERMMTLLNTQEHQYEYYPHFFRHQFIPEDEANIYNQWTEFVKNCDWYQKYVPKGERDGLIF